MQKKLGLLSPLWGENKKKIMCKILDILLDFWCRYGIIYEWLIKEEIWK